MLTDSVGTDQSIHYFSFTKIVKLMLHKETVAVLTSIKKRNQLCEQNAVHLNANLSVHKETTLLSDVCTLITGKHIFARI